MQVGEENLIIGNSFRRHNCSAHLAGVAEVDRIVVDLDKVFPHGKQGENLCECVIFYIDDKDNLVIVPIELKGGKNAEAKKAVEQLRGGTKYADTYAPILFHNQLNKAEVRRLKQSRSRIQFHGKSFEVKTARCGSKLIDVIQ